MMTEEPTRPNEPQEDGAEDARFAALTDEQVVEAAQGGDDEALTYLLNKYKNFVRSKARSYFLIGADHEDIVQEGMIGLFKAIRDFKPTRLASFRAFAELCVKRQIITAIKTATRQKHFPLNSYVSLNKPLYDEESDRTLLDVIEGRVTNPEELFISQEELIRDHSGIPHGGFVIRSGKTGWNDENSHVIEYSLKLDSNPEFTSSVLVAYARAAYRLNKEGRKGCLTVFDVAPVYLSAEDPAKLRKHLL